LYADFAVSRSTLICFLNLHDSLCHTFLHLLRVVYISVHRECCGCVAEAHLNLFCTDFLLGEERRVRVSERMKTEVLWKVQMFLDRRRYVSVQ